VETGECLKPNEVEIFFGCCEIEARRFRTYPYLEAPSNTSEALGILSALSTSVGHRSLSFWILLTSPPLTGTIEKMSAAIFQSLKASAIETPERVAIAVVALLLLATFNFFRKSVDPKEPPVVNPRIPIIGHFLGILYHGVPYYGKAR
jgi:hypothetical protein